LSDILVNSQFKQGERADVSESGIADIGNSYSLLAPACGRTRDTGGTKLLPSSLRKSSGIGDSEKVFSYSHFVFIYILDQDIFQRIAETTFSFSGN